MKCANLQVGIGDAIYGVEISLLFTLLSADTPDVKRFAQVNLC
jgi:hypothetical protein